MCDSLDVESTLNALPMHYCKNRVTASLNSLGFSILRKWVPPGITTVVDPLMPRLIFSVNAE
jgi:hypothetical protein